jgi:hypothetical protein
MKNNNLWPGDAVISLSFSDNSLKKGTYIYLHSRPKRTLINIRENNINRKKEPIEDEK